MTERAKSAAAALLAGGLALGLAGCGGSVAETMGFVKRAPDETRVVEQAPLELPPDFGLRPPSPGAPRPQEQSAADQAAAVLGAGAPPGAGTAAPGTAGERQFLNMAGANDADPGIRRVIDREAQVFVADDPGFIDNLMFWRQPSPVETEVVLDAVAEAERLSENQAAGRPVTEGATPVITRGERAPLEGLNPF